MTSYSFTKSKNGLSKYISSLCTPAHIYLILAFLSTILYVYTMLKSAGNEKDNIKRNHYTLMGLVCKIAWHTLYLLFLDYLCRKGHKTVSWVVLFLPFILMLMILVLFMFMFSFIASNDNDLKNLDTKVKDKRYSDLANKHEADLVNDGRPSITPDGMLLNTCNQY